MGTGVTISIKNVKWLKKNNIPSRAQGIELQFKSEYS